MPQKYRQSMAVNGPQKRIKQLIDKGFSMAVNLVKVVRLESKIYLGRVRSPRFILDVSGVQDLSWTSNCPESKIYLGRLNTN
jgi:hypothetical protein